jgi:tRNA(Ile)-lysidine synthetase-like protein
MKKPPGISKTAYPKPGPSGGRLIRQVIAELRAEGLQLPTTSHILIAVSGGSDSLALAHLLARYGRRVAPRGKLVLLHVNHGWRGAESEADERFVRRCAERWGVRFVGRRLKLRAAPGESWEHEARELRKAVFAAEARKRRALVLTAHQADDLAETLLWRLFTGAAATHGGGIVRRHGVELRPLLGVRKRELQAYLFEERVAWREDSTNSAGRFLRSRLRREVLPAIERLFPRAVEHLVTQALAAQRARRPGAEREEAFSALFGVASQRLRRAHWRWVGLEPPGASGSKPSSRITLAGGWTLVRQRLGGRFRWILEKDRGSAPRA